MEIVYMVFFPLIAFVLVYNLLSSSKTHRVILPPGPPALPIVGHLHILKPPHHHLFLRLSRRYGPIFSLWYGSRRVVVVSSSSLAQECFTGQNDVILSNRPRFLTAKYIGYNYTTIGTAPYGDYWRNLRRITSIEILSSHRLTTFLPVRKDEIRRMLTSLSLSLDDSKSSFVEVNLRPLFVDLTFNNVVRMVTGKIYNGNEVHNEEEANLFKKLVAEVSKNAGANHPGDYLPILKVFGHKYEKKVKDIGEAMDAFLQRLLEECRQNRGGTTMVNHLVSLQETDPQFYTDQTIKGLMLAMMLPATETSSVTLEWAMTNLIQNPEILNKAKSEIDDKIGQDRLIDESDMPNLPYLQNIVSETLRLQPASPLLVPRETSDDIKVGGYDVPRGTILIVNAWAIHRDPNLWRDPESFRPERFSACRGGSEAQKHLMTFGSGRRSCPGAGLAQRLVALAVGSLIQCFDWEKINGEDIDMADLSGLSSPKKEPLQAMCRSRPIMRKLTAQIK